MLLGPNSEPLEACSQTFVKAGTVADSAVAWNRVAWPASESVLQPQEVRLNYDGIVETASRLFSSVAEPIGVKLESSSGFLKTGVTLLGAGASIGKGMCWPKLDSVNLYVGQIQQQLLSFESDLSKVYLHLSSALLQVYPISYWYDDFENLYSQASELGVGTSRLRRARRLAAENATQACRLLASEIRAAITEKIAHLRRRLRVAKALKSKLLRLFASVFQFRNQIILQRRYYLAHGSHPIECSTCQENRLGSGSMRVRPSLPTMAS
jgi:hypothetical protein